MPYSSKEKQDKHNKLYYEKNRLIILARRRNNCSPSSRSNNKDYVKKYKERHPEKIMAKVAVRKAIREGYLIRQSCEICGKPKAEAHHDNYERPLDVRWLCTKHHKQFHRMEG